MREIKFSFIFQHYETGRFVERIRSLEDIAEKGYPDEGLGGYTFVSQRQYTGLTDKSGTCIYEGDILKTYNGIFFVQNVLPFIELVDNCNNSYDNGDYYHGRDIEYHDYDDFEVIGNIYENPELLAKKP